MPDTGGTGYVADVAIIGMAGRFPGAVNIEHYWRNLREGVESVSFFTAEELEESGIDAALVRDPRYVKAAPLLPHDPGLFDAAFFGFTPREAELMDPQHRVLVECAWEALEHAGYDPEQFDGRIGVYAGASLSSYLLFNLASNPDLVAAAGGFHTLIRNDKDYLATNISYKLNLGGPSISVQTACSTALVAVHLACQSLLNRECDLALAGGIRIVVPQKSGYLHEAGGVFSDDGHCRPFDHRASGTMFGSGAGLVVLKRLEDALAARDEIYAVVKGSAVNNDGALKVGFTAPGFEGQAQVIAEALTVAGVPAKTISYVETHGTGTPLGDPMEIAALARAYKGAGNQPRCAIGSVKSNFGHLEAAAGIAGLIKTVLALKHREIPPSLHFEKPNPQIDFANSPFYVNATLSPWNAGPHPRRAGISSFGIGGTNAHAVLEEAPASEPAPSARPRHLLVFSAKTATALDAATANLAEHFEQHPGVNLADAAYTLQIGRRALAHRRVLVCRDTADAAAELRKVDAGRVLTSSGEPRERPVAWMFPGQGSQYVNMGAELYRAEPVFREQVDRCAAVLLPHLNVDLRRILYPEASPAADLSQTWLSQPALFVIEYALACLWTAWGVRPVAMIGHSIGEYVAACLAGVFSLEDGLALVAARARLMQGLPAGAMLAIPLPEREVQAFLHDGVSLAAVNAPALCTATGPREGIEQLAGQLAARGAECRMLHTSHAFHSSMMDPIIGPFRDQVARICLKPPQTPYVSNLTGAWIRFEEAVDPDYWARHLRSTVRFADGLQTLARDSDAILLEVGPGQTLGSFVRQLPGRPADQVAFASLPSATVQVSDFEVLLTTLGRLWLSGLPTDWSAFHARERRRRIPLPSYPFERKRYWVEARRVGGRLKLASMPESVRAEDVHGREFPVPRYERPDIPTAYAPPDGELERTIAAIWQDVLGVERVGRNDDFFELGGHSLLLISLRSKLQEALQVEIQSHWLPEASTVARLAACVEAVRHGETATLFAHSPLVAIQPNGARPPLFCVHPNAAKLPGFADLARLLGPDQPFYGLQAEAVNSEGGVRLSVEAMAKLNIETMLGVQPRGPYLLAGYSFGGIVAFEMARQLMNSAAGPALLVLLDSMPVPAAVSAEGMPGEPALLAWFAWELGRLYRKQIDFSLEALLRLDTEAGLRYVLDRAGISHLTSEAAFTELTSLFRLFCANIEALWEYAPGSYSGPLHVFRAQETLGGDLLPALPARLLRHVLNIHLADPTYGWSALTSIKPTVHTAQGNHYDMLSEPHVRKLAGQLGKCIEAACHLTHKARVPANMTNHELTGTWRLVSWELRTSENELVLYPFGEAVGYLIYSDNGYMSLSIMKSNRPRSNSDNPLTSNTEENAAAAESYFSYCGRYEARDGKVIHHVEAGLFPNWVGESQERLYTITGDRLTLIAPSPVGSLQLANHLIWERLR